MYTRKYIVPSSGSNHGRYIRYNVLYIILSCRRYSRIGTQRILNCDIINQNANNGGSYFLPLHRI